MSDRDIEVVRAVLERAAHDAMDEQAVDFQMGLAVGDQVDLAFEALDRIEHALETIEGEK